MKLYRIKYIVRDSENNYVTQQSDTFIAADKKEAIDELFKRCEKYQPNNKIEDFEVIEL